MRGEPRLARLLDRSSFGLRRPRVAIRGTDLAGTVEAVGAEVTRWRVGDHVFGEGTATLADHAVVPADQLAAAPRRDGLRRGGRAAARRDHRTALPGGRRPGAGRQRPAQRRFRWRRHLRHPAGQGPWRLHVTAVVSPRNKALADSLGADRVIDYTADDFTRDGSEHDVVVDLVGNRGLSDLRRAVRPGGALVLSGGGILRAGPVRRPPQVADLGSGLRQHARAARADAAGGAGAGPARPDRRARRHAGRSLR